MQNTAPHILIVDDHGEIRAAVCRDLERSGLRTTMAKDTGQMDAVLASENVDLVVLDVMMPGEDGLSACRRLSRSGDIAILLLTALSEDIDRIVGLETGADDYLAKPFNPRELLAQGEALYRENCASSTAGRSRGNRTGVNRMRMATCPPRPLACRLSQRTQRGRDQGAGLSGEPGTPRIRRRYLVLAERAERV